MALKKDFEFNGVQVPDGYLVINSISGNKTQIGFNVDYKSSFENDPIKQENFAFFPNMEGFNFIRQAYEYLKTLDEFADAKDC